MYIVQLLRDRVDVFLDCQVIGAKVHYIVEESGNLLLGVGRDERSRKDYFCRIMRYQEGGNIW